MGKSLKEALAEQMVALRERGIAPEELPEGEEPEAPLPTNGYEAESRPRKLGKRAVAKRHEGRPASLSRATTAVGERPTLRPAPRPPSIGKMLEHRAEQRR